MRSTLRLLLLAGALGFGLAAHAEIFTVDPIDGYTCADNMTTEGCFSDPTSAAGSTGPVPTKCTAHRRQNRECRECYPEYDATNHLTGRAICVYVPWSSACACKDPKTTHCVDQGACTYYVI